MGSLRWGRGPLERYVLQCRGETHLCSFCRWTQVTVEEVMTTTAYLDLFLRSISEPALLEIFLRFILLHQHENVHILDTLTSRINTPFRVRRAPVEGKLWLRTEFRRVCFWNKTMNILFFLFPLLLFSFQPFLFCFGRDELGGLFCCLEPFCLGGRSYCLL